ncbi:IS1634 family transposase [Succinimonas amylolytica]|uniref:IS1634 family transposase n=1 Tax=Succinimonas amylolytica TaxID=83769 RepID=UPI000366FA70|nr:hypothetical protein [Succinimonas amylolytica]
MGIYVAIKSSGKMHEKYLSVVENYRDKDGKKKQRTVASFGKLKDALKEDPQIIEKLKLKYEHSETTERKQLLNKISNDVNDDALQTFAKLRDNLNNAPLFNGELNYGIQALRPIWNDWLGLYYKLNYLQQENSKLKCNISDIAQYLTALKIIDPHSYFCGYRSQYKYLCNPIQNVSISDIYNTIEFIGQNRSAIMEYINRKMVEKYNRNLTMVFYDCSNVYFESPYDDREHIFRALMTGVRKQFKEENKEINEAELREMSSDPEKINEVINKLKSMLNEDTCWRMRGMFKEHRYDLPLVSVALTIDDRGIPVDFDIFPGNFSEYKTMPKVIGNMKKKYNIQDTIVVADCGLNSIGNIEMLVNHKLGFIVAQKVSNLQPEYEAVMYDHSTGYKLWNTDKENSQSNQDETNNKDKAEYCTRKNDLKDDEFVFKRIPYIKEVIVTDENGKKHKAAVDCEILFTFSPKRYKRDIAQLEDDLVKAREAVAQKKDMAPCGAGWKSLVSVKKEVTETSAEPNNNVPEGQNLSEQDVSSKRQQENNKTEKGRTIKSTNENISSRNDALESNTKDKQTQNSKKSRKKSEEKSKKSKSCDLYKAEKIKEDVVEERRKRAGYVAIIFKQANDNNSNNKLNNSKNQIDDNNIVKGSKGITDSKLLTCHDKLVKIEECFRIMKSNFSIRPVYVRKKINICGHITLCVIALIIMRLMEIKLKDAGTPLTIEQIQTALNSTVTAMSNNGKDGLFIKNNEINNFIDIKEWKELSSPEKNNSKESFITSFLNKKKYLQSDIDKILKVVGLEPLCGICSPSTVCQKLKIRSNYQDMIGNLLSDIQSAVYENNT